jgi:ribosomal protein S10
MFINIELLSKNQCSLNKLLILFNSFCIKKPIKKNRYTEKKNIYMLKKKLNNILYVKYKYRYVIKKWNIIEKNKKKIKINGFLSYLQQKQKLKFFTILKSPHLNKTAQEQIEYRKFSKQIVIFSLQIFKFLILLKKIKNNIFPDVEIQIKFIIKNKTTEKTKLIAINPDNYRIKKFFYDKNNTLTIKDNRKKDKILKQKQTISYLKLFDIYGELYFKNCLDSSVGRAKD